MTCSMTFRSSDSVKAEPNRSLVGAQWEPSRSRSRVRPRAIVFNAILWAGHSYRSESIGSRWAAFQAG